MDKVISTIRDSDLLDQKWYLSEYPDVAALNMDPAVHYVQLGALLYRDPGPKFSTKSYLADYPDVLQAGINPLYHYLVWGEEEGRDIRRAKHRSINEAEIARVHKVIETALQEAKSTTQVSAIELPDWHRPRAALFRSSDALLPFSVEDFEVKLWGGYSQYALEKLEELKYMSDVPVGDRVNIGWHLYRWYSISGDNNKALENIRLAKYYCNRMGSRTKVARKKIAVAEAQCLARMGKIVQARKVLDSATKQLGEGPTFWLAQATVAGSGDTLDHSSISDRDAPLEWINKLYEASGLALLRKEREGEPLSFFNVTAEDVNIKPISDCPEKISIIIPAYNAAETIHISVSSLLRQTWSNLEVIVVDDCSTDNTADVVAGYAARDKRVKLIRKEVNGGAYPARNLGLKHVTGDLVLVHDSDDWSHPQKIEMQMAELNAHPKAVAVMSHWVRFDENLRPMGPWRPTGNYFDLNFSSLMARRHVIECVGGWDEVRISGDAEYRFRILKKYGEDAVRNVPPRYLLSLSLTRSDSLTQTKATHLRSLDFGLRWLYRDAYQYWHASAKFRENPRIDNIKGKARPFPAPYILRSRSSEQVQYDAVIISDLSYEPYAVEVVRYVQSAVEKGHSIGLIHWPRYDRYVHLPVYGKVYDLCINEKVNIITNGESAATRLAVLLHPDVAQYKLDQFPQISAENVLLIARDFPIRPLVGVAPDQVLQRIQSHVSELFDKPVFWQGGSVTIKRMLKESGVPQHLVKDIWLPVLETHKDSVRRRANRIERAVASPPVLGRGFNYEIGSTWPKNFRDIKRGYCADSDMQVVLMGAEDLVCSQFGRHPKNWSFLENEASNIEEFLSKIDFYLYFPATKYAGDFDETLFSSMARGIPPVMPKKFKPIFGDCAIYAVPDNVENTVLSFWKSPEKYKEISKKARIFVMENCVPEKILQRMMQAVEHIER